MADIFIHESLEAEAAIKFVRPQTGAAVLGVVQQRLGRGTLMRTDETFITEFNGDLPSGKYLFQPGKSTQAAAKHS